LVPSLISSIQYKKADSTVLGALTYDYDGTGNRTLIGDTFAETALPPAVTSTSYDNANQLIQWVAASGTTGFTLDANGNLQTAQAGSNTDTYNWDARNMLTSIVDQASVVKASFVRRC
jgi:YD repeat-containing protein